MGSSSGLQAEKKEQTTRTTSGWWLRHSQWALRVKGSCLGRGLTQVPLPSLPCSQEPSKNSLWAWGKQLLMTRWRINDHWEDIPMYLFIDTKNMPTRWNLGCIHGISYHSLLSADRWLVPLTRDEGGKDRPRQRLQLKSIIRKVPLCCCPHRGLAFLAFWVFTESQVTLDRLSCLVLTHLCLYEICGLFISHIHTFES